MPVPKIDSKKVEEVPFYVPRSIHVINATDGKEQSILTEELKEVMAVSYRNRRNSMSWKFYSKKLLKVIEAYENKIDNVNKLKAKY